MAMVQQLLENGLALTRQRILILETMHGRSDHPDAEMVYCTLRKHLPSLSLETVYRTLNLFAERGIIRKLAVPTRRFRFDGGIKTHDHFNCTRCQAIFDVPNAAILAAPVPVPVVASSMGRIHA